MAALSSSPSSDISDSSGASMTRISSWCARPNSSINFRQSAAIFLTASSVKRGDSQPFQRWLDLSTTAS